MPNFFLTIKRPSNFNAHETLPDFFSFGQFLAGHNSTASQSVILVYLDGGPSQTDTFDPKPEATREIYGNLKEAIQTNVPGIIIGAKLPLLAQMADKYSLIRSMTHGNNGHETGHYAMITGDLSRSFIVYPSYGSVIAFMKALLTKAFYLRISLLPAPTVASMKAVSGQRIQIV